MIRDCMTAVLGKEAESAAAAAAAAAAARKLEREGKEFKEHV
jgi:hypothetical protein